MVVGLGTGSTAALVVEALAERAREGLQVLGVPTSEATARQARELGIPLTTLQEHPNLDLDIDGADEVSPERDLIKGLGGALLREKIVALAARRLVIVVDESKLVEHLGERASVPVEVIPFGWTRCVAALERLGGSPRLRQGPSGPVLTDGGNWILDTTFPPGGGLSGLAGQIKAITGVVEHGLFVGLDPKVFVGQADGGCRVLG